ncbi:hypothetical protein OGAPHI_003643 [Ogataea philodendri]|uniref:Ataxin-10 homolog n=1 Tax=Ogataea philodendri TaxID=1378263 RepID=A0A9P8P6B0_9ASCO|nr:uncharacterized protein OGAPHI_003643 [Ogataea philodendri]KAH3665459.1 hypothetical protein OGAPHI_003643 [Ogataea philodendri]
MSREQSLTILSEILEILRSAKPVSKLEPEIKDCLSRFSFLITLTANDTIERQKLANSLSIWTKINEVFQLYLETVDADPQLVATPLAQYKTRLIRGVILLARNLIVGLRDLLNLDDKQRSEFYHVHGLRCKDVSGDILIQSLYQNHFNNIIPLCLRFLDILDSFPERSPKHSIEIYYNSITSCFQYLNNVTNIDTKWTKQAVPDYNVDAFLDFLTRLPQYWHAAGDQVLPDFDLLVAILMYFRNLFSQDELLTRIFRYHSVRFIVFVGNYLSYIVPYSRGCKHFTQEQCDQLELVYLGTYMNMISHESVGSCLLEAANSNTNKETAYNAISELLNVFQIILTSKEEGWDKLKLVNIVAWITEYYKYASHEASVLLDKQTLGAEESEKLARLHKQLISVLDSLSSLTKFDSVRQMLNYYEFLPQLVAFFQVVDRNTFRKRLKDEQSPPNTKEFPQVKLIMIEIITSLVYQNFKNQELMREIHGLELILNNCNLDTNEPFIKERAILCIKYLLLDNPGNQDFVAKLEAKGTSIDAQNKQILEQAGFEIDIEDGKVKLKKSPRVTELEQGATGSCQGPNN